MSSSARITVAFSPCPDCGQRHDRRQDCHEARDRAPETIAVSTLRRRQRKARPDAPKPKPAGNRRLLRARPHKIDYDAIRDSMDSEGVPRLGHTDRDGAEESAYTTDPTAALPGEPEAISREEQERLTIRAEDESLASLLASRERLSSSIEAIEDHPAFPESSLRSELGFAKRQMENVLDKVERRIRTAESRPA